MTPQQFEALQQQGYNRIPVHKQILVDTLTPVGSYLAVAQGEFSFFLESVHGGETWGRYSIIGLPCQTRIEIHNHDISVIENSAVTETLSHDHPLDFVESFHARFKVAHLDNLPRFYGGLVGYFGYDCVRFVETRLKDSIPRDELGLADCQLMLAEEVLVFDNLSGTLHLIILANPEQDNALENAEQKIEKLITALKSSNNLASDLELSKINHAPKVSFDNFESSFGEQAFKDAVEKVREYILAGDCMQVVLSQRLSTQFKENAFDLYRVLRYLNPSPYMYYLNLGEGTYIVGASPEVLARVEDQQVTVRPIAGTRRRGHTREEDLAMEQELLNDEKELAEHLMLIDLGRNDVGRVSETGSVRVTEQYQIERYSHVMHIISNVVGTLDSSHSSLDALRSILPAGTLSGAPKVRAMEIIDEFEPVKRGIYGGAIGYLSWTGEMDTAIAIRTAVIHQEKLYVQAGGGLVADSQPQLEWKESINKASAIFAAVDALLAMKKESAS